MQHGVKEERLSVLSGDLDGVYTEPPLETGEVKEARHVEDQEGTGVEAQGPQTL